MMRTRHLLACLPCVAACSSSPPGKTYYQRNIEPILLQNCATNTSGCHSTNPDDPYQFAAGNFDCTSFDNVQKRRDLLQPFGAYPQPLLLIKAVAPATMLNAATDPNTLTFQYGTNANGDGVFLPIQVLHAGGTIIQVNSADYFTLQTWMANGATKNGVKPPTPAQTGNGTCSTTIPASFNPAALMSNPNYAAGLAAFKSNVQPILSAHGCVSSNCHGAPQSDFYITCGQDDNQIAFNFSQAWSFVDNPVDQSQILRVPLAVAAGGRGHTGGDQFPSTSDGDYNTIKTWASQVGKLDFANGDPVKQFFADNVQPILVARGCSFEACHSPMATNDFKLRSGTQGFFSAIALQRNYDLLLDNFMAVEFPDARRGRAIAKTVLPDDYRIPSIGGISHRGGSILETPGGLPSDPAMCPSPWTTASSPFCTVQEFLRLQRAALGLPAMAPGDAAKVVYVERPVGQAADRLEFDTFQGGADLMALPTTYAAGQTLNAPGAPTSLIGSCGLGGSPDIGMPDVAPDGDTVAFAGRVDAASAWGIYTLSLANPTNCARITALDAPAANGILIHNFDPAWSPDGANLVFASTRGKSGPTVSRKRFLPQSDLWRVAFPVAGPPTQMTFLSNSEIRPHFMREGRVTMTTEKASDGFYQLSGRRINWDLTDYHPLLAQRATSLYADDTTNPMSTKPSIGYSAATDVREGNDGNFLLVLSDVDGNGKPVVPGGGGALATFNRSIGPFESGRGDPGYFKSVRILGDGAATGHAGATAAYRAPFYLPDGQILAAYASPASALAWQLVVVSPRTGAQTVLYAPAGKAAVDAVLAYKYPPRALYLNRRQLVFGGAADPSDASHATVHLPDAPMLFTLLTGNLRRGRPVDAFRSAKNIAVYTEGTCPSGCTANTNGIYQNRQMLGKASLASDGSVRFRVPSGTGVVLELQDGNGNRVVTMGEEHQYGPGEQISMGISQNLFDAVCGGCHGSVSGSELDIAVTADALTGASQSASATASPASIGP